MTKYLLSPVPIRHTDNNAKPVPFARLHTWVAGTTTPQATYTDATGSTPLANPVIADAGGYFPQIWGGAAAYDLECRKSDDISVVWDSSNVIAAGAEGVSYFATLAASSGSSLIGFTQAGAGAVTSTVQAELRDRFSAKQFGAKGDATTDDTAAVPLASTAAGYAREYVVTSFTDSRGRDLMPDGVAHNRSSGRVYNPRPQIPVRFFGQETLQWWFSKFFQAARKNSGDGTVRTIVISGDSTTFGVGATYGTPAVLLEDLAEQRGYTNVGVINRGQSGKATFDWVSTYLAGDLAANPDLLILRWGANDPYFGHTADQFLSDLRAGLTTIRASKTVAQMSILLMTPTSMNDVEKGRTEVWSEQINAGIRQAARDFQCAFIDSYGLFQNSHDAANIWMDLDSTFYSPGRSIHPHDVLYEHLMGKVADMIYPTHGTDWKVNAMRNTSGGDSQAVKTGAEQPSDFFAGIGMHRMAVGTGTVDGTPYDGVAFTWKQADGVTVQWSVPIKDGAKGSGMTARIGWNGAWSAWYGGTITGTAASALLANGWANTGGAYQPFLYQLTLEGRVCLNGVINKGTVTDGTTVFTLPAGYRPRATEILLLLTDTGVCRIAIDTSGVAKVYGFGGTAAYLSLGGASFRVGLT